MLYGSLWITNEEVNFAVGFPNSVTTSVFSWTRFFAIHNFETLSPILF